jgi:hypothetical protein
MEIIWTLQGVKLNTHIRDKKGEYLKDKINQLATYSKNKNMET